MERGRFHRALRRSPSLRTCFLAAAVALLISPAVAAVQPEGQERFVLSADEALDLLDDLIERRPLDRGRMRFEVEGKVTLAGVGAPFLAKVEQKGARAVVNVSEAPPFVPREIEAVLGDARSILDNFEFAFSGVEFLGTEPQAVFKGTLREGGSGARQGSVWISLETGELRRIALSYWWGTVDSTLEYGLELGHNVVRNQQIHVSPWGLSLNLRYHGFQWFEDGEDAP